MSRNVAYGMLRQTSTTHDAHYDDISTSYKAPSVDNREVEKPGDYSHSTGTPLPRFWLRGFVAVGGPLLVVIYFIILWQVFLTDSNQNSPLAFGRPGATWVFYSWFLAGIIGLSLSLYGLAGVEASMLMDEFWHVRDATTLMLHADNTWSGPGGWLKAFKWAIKLNREGRGRLPSRLWFILALPSVFIFIAWPLSGLTLELTPGFYHSSRNGIGSTVTGFSHSIFNERNVGTAKDGASVTWRNAFDAVIPGAGIVYTPKGMDRSNVPFLNKLPSTLPKKNGVTRLFLTSQAENPIEGQQWGMLLQYNCSTVTKASDFRILNQRNATLGKNFATSGTPYYSIRNGTQQIHIFNQTDRSWVQNIAAVMEMGMELYPNTSALAAYTAANPTAFLTPQAGCYYNKMANISGDYPGIDQEQTFEVALWQWMYAAYLGDPRAADAPQYNFTVDHNITELYGAYDFRSFSPPSAEYSDQSVFNSSSPMFAIGVQCRASSSVGTAEVDGVQSSFANFQRTDTPINLQSNRCAGRFAADTPHDMLSREPKWIRSLFGSVAASPPFFATYTSDPDSVDVNGGYEVQLSYFQAEQLRQSMLRAYASYATQLMYNGGQGFTTRNGSQLTFFNPNITEFRAGTVLKRGVVPPAVPFALFMVWLIISCTLGIVYGFRRRWTEVLDGHTMFRLGVEISSDDRRDLVKTPSLMDIDECTVLDRMPGLVGDAKPESIRGRIGLVRNAVADKNKLYE